MKYLSILMVGVALLMGGCGSGDDSTDLDDPTTLDKIIAEAIDEERLELRGEYPKRLAYDPNQQTPYTGWVKEMYDDGKVSGLHHLKDGKRDGLATVWYRDGQKSSETTYKDDKLDGPETRWHLNGQKKSETTWKDFKRDGPETSWYENGQKKTEGTYKDGKADGQWTGWHSNGEISSETTYKDGKKDGPEKRWDSNGQKSSKNGSRLVIVTTTSDIAHSGTNDLGLHAHIIGIDGSRLDLGHLDNDGVNDLEKGQTSTFSMPFDYPVSKIKGIELTVKGEDAWRAEIISFQFFDGGKKSEPFSFDVDQWFSSEQADIDKNGAVASKMFSFRPELK
jgi:hypothetical protein